MSTLNTKLDAAQVLRQAYDEPNQRIKVDASVSATISDVTIADPDGDQMDVNPDGSINVKITSPLDIEVSAADGDNIAISDGTDTLAINTNGSINVVSGNATGAYATNVGTTNAQTLRTTSNVADGSANPLTSSLTNSHRLLHSQTPDTSVTPIALGIANAVVSISVEGLNSVGFQLNSGTLIGTLVAEASVDGGTKWAAVPFYDPANSSVLTNLVFTSANPDRIVSIIPIGGSSNVRVRVLAYTSGSATGLLRATQVSGTIGTTTASAFGNVINTFPTILANVVTLILPANVNRKYAYLSNNSASTLRIQFFDGAGLEANTGLPVEAQTYFELKGDNLFTGDVYALAASDVTLSISEGSP